MTAAALSLALFIGLGRIARAHIFSPMSSRRVARLRARRRLSPGGIVERDGLAARPAPPASYRAAQPRTKPAWRMATEPSGARRVRLTLAAAATIIAVSISIGLIDRPIADVLPCTRPRRRPPLRADQAVAVSAYPLPDGLRPRLCRAALGRRFAPLRLRPRDGRDAGLCRRSRLFSSCAVAASGLAVDLLKVISVGLGRNCCSPAGSTIFRGSACDPITGRSLRAISATTVALATAFWSSGRGTCCSTSLAAANRGLQPCRHRRALSQRRVARVGSLPL